MRAPSGFRLLPAIILILALPSAAPAASWAEEKCARYGTIWAYLLEHQGKGGLGADFLSAHEAFMADGCTGPRAVCPVSDAEIAMADSATILVASDGITGTFLPFQCR